MQGIADTMAYLQKEGRLLRGEHNLLAEAFLIIASASGYVLVFEFQGFSTFSSFEVVDV